MRSTPLPVFFFICIRSIGLTILYCFKILWITLVRKQELLNTRAQIDLMTANWSRSLLAHINSQVTVHNPAKVNFNQGTPTILMSNHTSLYDIPLLFYAINGPVRMVTKQEIRKIPIFGKALEVGEFVYIDRRNTNAAVESLKIAGEKMKSGINIWLSPEGTRSDGKLHPLKKGGFRMALSTGARIVPISIKGAEKIIPQQSLLKINRNTEISITIHPPLHPKQYTSDGEGISALMEDLRRKIDPNIQT